MRYLALLMISLMTLTAARADGPRTVPANRVASVLISEDFINEQLSAHVKSDLLKEMRVSLDPVTSQIYFRGILQIPMDELRAINIDSNLGEFKFQATIKPETTKQGHLILDFPLAETFLYPITAKHPESEKIIVPVQLLSVALASARGYLAALSGDFSGFDRRTAKLKALKHDLDRSIAKEKNADALDELKTQRKALEIQLAAVPIERKQLETTAKQIDKVLGLTGEKEINFNEDLAAKRNALILKIKLSQLVPYLGGVELGGLRIIHDTKDGSGQNYFAIDINSVIEGSGEVTLSSPTARPPMKTPPSLIVRLNQSVFESEALLQAEKKAAGSKLKNVELRLSDDGLHAAGTWKFLFLPVPFDTTVDFVLTQPDVFDVRMRDVKIAGLDLEFLSKYILESIQSRLEHGLKGLCQFSYVGEEKDHSRALRVTLDPKKMLPAFPELHLVGVDVRDREFLMKIGHL